MVVLTLKTSQSQLDVCSLFFSFLYIPKAERLNLVCLTFWFPTLDFFIKLIT